MDGLGDGVGKLARDHSTQHAPGTTPGPARYRPVSSPVRFTRYEAVGGFPSDHDVAEHACPGGTTGRVQEHALETITSASAPPASTSVDLQQRVAELEKRVRTLSAREGLTLCVFSNDLDKLLAAFSIATGAAACGLRVSMFFTFWGTTLLRREAPQSRGKRLVERMFGWMLPAGPRQQTLSRLHMGGIGRLMIGREMKRKGIPALPEMIEMAKTSGVEILACSMSMDLMGIRREELLDYPNLRVCGATQFVDMAADGNVTLFV